MNFNNRGVLTKGSGYDCAGLLRSGQDKSFLVWSGPVRSDQVCTGLQLQISPYSFAEAFKNGSRHDDIPSLETKFGGSLPRVSVVGTASPKSCPSRADLGGVSSFGVSGWVSSRGVRRRRHMWRKIGP